jgi:hypothetical protein
MQVCGPGNQTGWMDLCSFHLRGSKFLVVDPSFAPSEADGVVIQASPGEYLAETKVMIFGTDRRISRLRVHHKHSNGIIGSELGKSSADTGQIGICDLEVFRKAWGTDDDAAHAKIEDAVQDSDFGVVVLNKREGAVMPFVQSGFGDGIFPVFELLEGGSRVGFEVEFIAEGAKYPFGSIPDQESSSMSEGSEDSDFYEKLGPEDISQKCKRNDCDRGVVRFSVLCKRHHFEMIQRRPCPF